MPTDRDIEQFIGESFSSIWDLELLAVVLERPEQPLTASELVERMRASELVVEQGVKTLVTIGLATLDAEDRLRFSPVTAELENSAREASEFYRRFPGRARRLLIDRHSPGLTAFADAFRLRKD